MTTFRDDRHRAKVCRVLLSFQNLERLWMADDIGPNYGPTIEATDLLRLIQRETCLLAASERVLIRVAFDFWNGAGEASIHDIQSYLNVNVIQAIGELLVAANENPVLKGEPVDRWLKGWRGFRVNHAPNGFTVE